MADELQTFDRPIPYYPNLVSAFVNTVKWGSVLTVLGIAAYLAWGSLPGRR